MFETPKNQKSLESERKEWFIIVGNQQLGPYHLLDLKHHPYFTPDTLVWKKGFKEWRKARFVPEMKPLFKDEEEPHPLHEPEEKKNGKSDLNQQNQAVLTLEQEPYPFLLWILLLLLILFYIFYKFYYQF